MVGTSLTLLYPPYAFDLIRLSDSQSAHGLTTPYVMPFIAR
jgi:hypothetical protein